MKGKVDGCELWPKWFKIEYYKGGSTARNFTVCIVSFLFYQILSEQTYKNEPLK